MAQLKNEDDPEPSGHVPAGLLYVPVRPGPAGCAARLFRTPPGGRTAVGFTTEERLAAVLGPGQAWIRLAEPALRALAEPLGVTALTVDPQLTAPAPAAPHRRRDDAWGHQVAGVLRVTAAVAAVDALSLWIG